MRVSLAIRITLSYVFGVVGSLLAVSSPSPQLLWSETFSLFAVYVAAGFIVSWPLYLAAVVAAFAFPIALTARPGVWTLAAVFVAASFSFLTLPYITGTSDHLLHSGRWPLSSPGFVSTASV
jgi:hypothetical protein